METLIMYYNGVNKQPEQLFVCFLLGMSSFRTQKTLNILRDISEVQQFGFINILFLEKIYKLISLYGPTFDFAPVIIFWNNTSVRYTNIHLFQLFIRLYNNNIVFIVPAYIYMYNFEI